MRSPRESPWQLVQVPEEAVVRDVMSFEPPTLDQEQGVPETAQSCREGSAGSEGRQLPWDLAAATSMSCLTKRGNWREHLQASLAKLKNSAPGNTFWKVQQLDFRGWIVLSQGMPP